MTKTNNQKNNINRNLVNEVTTMVTPAKEMPLPSPKNSTAHNATMHHTTMVQPTTSTTHKTEKENGNGAIWLHHQHLARCTLKFIQSSNISYLNLNTLTIDFSLTGTHFTPMSINPPNDIKNQK
jgi:hypothetical protein